mgnify:FL=1
MDAIVAVYSDWGIGADGTQPIVLKADRQRFVELTRGRTVIVGRRTLADFPGGRPLKGRRNIIITRQDIAVDGAETAHGVQEAARLCGGGAIILGGQSVFREFMPLTDRVFVTKIMCCPQSDSYFENLDESPEWRVADQGEALREGDIEYRFMCYERIRP